MWGESVVYRPEYPHNAPLSTPDRPPETQDGPEAAAAAAATTTAAATPEPGTQTSDVVIFSQRGPQKSRPYLQDTCFVTGYCLMAPTP